MPHFSTVSANFAPKTPEIKQRRVLVVDDSRAQRTALRLQLTRWGYLVTEAESGADALALCSAQKFEIILSDWVMPQMDGLEFCNQFRNLVKDRYGYFVLLTSKSEKAEIAKGLESGADDFLTKPFNGDELRARLRAGERILQMQEELFEKNALVGDTLSQLQKVYDSLDRDLIEARKLQLALVREKRRDYGRGRVHVMLRPSGHVGGDLVGSFSIDDHRIAVFAVDVSGHGVASAMMTARLAGLLSGSSPDQNIALRPSADGTRRAFPPVEVAARLNSLMLDELQVDQYFTLAYAQIDVISGAGVLLQAGHPHPMILRSGGTLEQLGDGGLPIGLIPQAQFDETHFTLAAGDRLIITSDGVTECENAARQELGQEGLAQIVTANQNLASPDLLEAIVWELQTLRAGAEFADDVSGLIFDYVPKD
ncbi:MAG: SpoIIE family protein phosphatase [Cypionkella sp.]|nr:SpoIIE family protein phosphatase [Cypionkella sp.]